MTVDGQNGGAHIAAQQKISSSYASSCMQLQLHVLLPVKEKEDAIQDMSLLFWQAGYLLIKENQPVKKAQIATETKLSL